MPANNPVKSLCRRNQNSVFSESVETSVGASPSASGRGGFEIYVDPTIDPDVGEIVIVKKKKSRAGLDGMSWGALGDATNVHKSTQVDPVTKQNPSMLKVKTDEEKKWWSIGRGRKDSKEKEKDGKENKMSNSSKCTSISFVFQRFELIHLFLFQPLNPLSKSLIDQTVRKLQDN
jgi:hypothetical protein